MYPQRSSRSSFRGGTFEPVIDRVRCPNGTLNHLKTFGVRGLFPPVLGTAMSES